MKELNDSTFCRLAPSPIHGIGVFAIRDIPKGQELTDCYGSLRHYILSKKEFDGLVPEVRELIKERTIFIKGKPLAFFSPNCNQMLQHFMNHSETPNSNGRYALVDIKKGEEITENYENL